MALNFPNSPTVGQVYTDTTSGFSYEWDGTVWKSYSPASASNIKILDDLSGSFNGSTKTFALASNGVSLTPANAQSLIITLGGVTQEPGVDYTVNTSNITFDEAPAAGLNFGGISLGPAVPITYANDGNIYIRNTYTGAGTTGPFSFPEGYTVGYLDVYRNGVRLRSGTDFVGTSGTNFFLTDAASTGDELEAIGYTITSIINASTSFDNLNVTGITTTGRLQVTTNANVVGIVTASGGFVGNVTGTASSATAAGTAYGLAGSPNITAGNITGTAATFTDLTVNGTQTIINTNVLEVADINIGIASTASKLTNTQLNGAGFTIYGSQGDKTLSWDNSNTRLSFNTDVYAPRYYGDGSGLSGVTAGLTLRQAGSTIAGGAATTVNFASGATITNVTSGIATITVGITTASYTASGITTTLNLSSAQDHKVTATGITTITVSGGTEGDSHTVRIVNSGIATVGFSTAFLFPSGSPPTLPTASGAISLLSFTVHRVGAAGTQLLAGASLNFS